MTVYEERDSIKSGRSYDWQKEAIDKNERRKSNAAVESFGSEAVKQ
jgi:hypothetical protein